jgi:hypothetical protein
MDAAIAARERLNAVQVRVAAYNAAVGGRGIFEGALKALGDVRAGAELRKEREAALAADETARTRLGAVLERFKEPAGSTTGVRSRRRGTSRASLASRSCGNGSASCSRCSSRSNGSRSRHNAS